MGDCMPEEEENHRTSDTSYGCPNCGAPAEVEISKEPDTPAVALFRCTRCPWSAESFDMEHLLSVIDGMALNLIGLPVERRMMMTQSSVEVTYDALKMHHPKQVNVKVYADDPGIAAAKAVATLEQTLRELQRVGLYGETD